MRPSGVVTQAVDTARSLALLRREVGRSVVGSDDRSVRGFEQFGDLAPVGLCGVVELEGEVDIYSSPQFADALRLGIDGGATRVVVDLAKVTFIDSTALGVVVGGIKRLRALRGTLDVVCEEENLKRIFEITGLNTILGIYPTRAEALAAATK